jgi:hypothetical protein
MEKKSPGVQFPAEHGAWVNVYDRCSDGEPEDVAVDEVGREGFPAKVEPVEAAKDAHAACDR